jgi:hypothetical protein
MKTLNVKKPTPVNAKTPKYSGTRLQAMYRTHMCAMGDPEPSLTDLNHLFECALECLVGLSLESGRRHERALLVRVRDMFIKDRDHALKQLRVLTIKKERQT